MTHTPMPNQQERTRRQKAIDALIDKLVGGEQLTIPEALALAECVQADRQRAEKTRRSLGDTTRALERIKKAAAAELEQHREAAGDEIQRLEARVELLVSVIQSMGPLAVVAAAEALESAAA